MSFYKSLALLTNIVLITIIVTMIAWFQRQSRIRKLEKRLGKYSIDSINDSRESLFDIIIKLYVKIRDKINHYLYKIKFLQKYSMKYEKYIDKTKSNKFEPMDFVSTKFICGFLICFLVLLNDVLQHRSMEFQDIFFGFAVGFFVPDIFLISRKTIKKKRMENDLLKAITIMNNSFKSGRSIIQTIKIVGEELDGPLQEEFQKMYRDLNYGLGIEIVFERFSERVKLDEVKYISTSLAILNETGGDIVKVFSSIEKTVFSNRKLKAEMVNLSASANLLSKVLMFIPIMFILVICLLDPLYFEPFFKTSLGLILFITIITIYVSYIVIIKKIIRLREY